MESGRLYGKLFNIQQKLKAPKDQFNAFGKYKYRSLENVLEELKPRLATEKCIVIFGDSMEQIGDRYYVKATLKLVDIETGEEITVTAWAREEDTKKGMDGSQITGAASSYARKYALNAMFAIDDCKDSDATNTGDAKEQKKEPEIICSKCGKTIATYTGKNGDKITPERHAKLSQERFGGIYCLSCISAIQNVTK